MRTLALLVAVSVLPAAAQERRTALTTEDLERAKALDAEFRAMLAKEDAATRADLEKAATLISKAEGWTWKAAFTTIRKRRSLAAVPLLISKLIERHEHNFIRRAIEQ